MDGAQVLEVVLLGEDEDDRVVAVAAARVYGYGGGFVYDDHVAVHVHDGDGLRCDGHLMSVHDVGQQVVVFEFVVDVHLLVVDGEGAALDAPLIFLGGVRSELPREHVQDLLADPAALGERGEGEVVRVDFPQPVLDVVRRLVVAVVGEPRALRLERLGLQLGLF